MWHEDILAWQQVAEAVVTNPSGSPGGFQVVIQDPARVILMISSFSPGAMFLALTPQFVPFGIQLGPDQGTQQQLVVQPGEVSVQVNGITGDTTNDPDGNTGTFAVTTPDELFLESQPGSVEGNWLNPRVGPLAMTWLWPRDGLLPKLEWWCYDVIGGQSLYVQSVTMNNRPCPTWRIGGMANGGSRVRVQRGCQSVRRGGNVLDPLAWPQSTPAGADLLPDES